MSINSIYVNRDLERINQGDILEKTEYYKVLHRSETEYNIDTIIFPYVVVLTQDCDLEWDYKKRKEASHENEDKFLESILVCPAFLSEKVRNGKYLSKLEFLMDSKNTNEWRKIKINQNPRFHFLKADSEIKMPELVIDFKHYYTIPREKVYEVKKDRYKTSVRKLFREDLSQRFAYFLSRIGLPSIKIKD